MGKIIHGDANSVLAKMDDNSVDLIVTDIPYGISFKSNRQGLKRGKNGETIKTGRSYFKEIKGDAEIPVDWLVDAFRILKQNSATYIFCHWSKWGVLAKYVEAAGFSIKNMIVMNKSNHGMGDLKGQYAPKHELLMYATKGLHLLRFTDKRMNDVWNVPVKFTGSHRLHPNEKPLAWLIPCISNSSNIGDVVLDPFAGSGSTGAAAKQLGREAILVELDEEYVNVMKQRLVK